MQEKTIFQKIIDREIPATIVYEDEKLCAFLDINPIQKGHVLLVPKEPYPWIQDVPEDILQSVMKQVQTMIPQMKQVLECDFVMLLVEGVDVPHFHIHLIPRYLEKPFSKFTHEQYSEGEKVSTGEKLSKAFN